MFETWAVSRKQTDLISRLVIRQTLSYVNCFLHKINCDNFGRLIQNIYTVAAAAGALIRKPENAIGLPEDPFILECFSDTSSISWSYNGSKVNVAGCTTIHPSFTTTADSNDTHCSLVVQGTNTRRLSGPYYCSDGTETAEAVVIIMGQYTISPYTVFLHVCFRRDTDWTSSTHYWSAFGGCFERDSWRL